MSKIGALRDLLFELLQEHARDGTIPTNARFVFYEAVARGHLSKERKRGDPTRRITMASIKEHIARKVREQKDRAHANG